MKPTTLLQLHCFTT